MQIESFRRRFESSDRSDRHSKSESLGVPTRIGCRSRCGIEPSGSSSRAVRPEGIAHVVSSGEYLVPRGRKEAILVRSAVSDSLQFD
jgi:hypothetical protein